MNKYTFASFHNTLLMKFLTLAAAILFSGTAASATSQNVLQSGAADVLVTQTTANIQAVEGVATDPRGNYVVVWNSGTRVGDVKNTDLIARCFNADGTPRGNEFAVDSVGAATKLQEFADVAMAPDGSFVVVWQENLTASSQFGGVIRGRRFASDCSVAGGAQDMSTIANGGTNTGHQDARVAIDRDGNIAVSFSIQTDGTGNDFFNLYLRRFTPVFVAIGNNIQVDVPSSFEQPGTLDAQNADTAFLNNGDLVIVWDAYIRGEFVPDLDNDIFTRRYTAGGAFTSIVKVSEDTNTGTPFLYDKAPRVAVQLDGSAVVVWVRFRPEPQSYLGRRLDSSGNPLGSNILLKSNAATDGFFNDGPTISSRLTGGYSTAWTDFADPGGTANDVGVALRRYDASFNQIGAEIRLNQFTTGSQFAAKVAEDVDGDLIAVWTDGSLAVNGQDGSLTGVYSRRFSGYASADLRLDLNDQFDAVRPSSTFHYRLDVDNLTAAVTPTGVAAMDSAINLATKISLKHTLPTGVSYSSFTGSNWSCTLSAPNVNCAYSGTLAAGASANPLFLNVTASSAIGTRTAQALATSAVQFDPNESAINSNNFDAVDTLVQASTVAFTQTSYSVNENVGSLSVTIRRSGALNAASSATFVTAPGFGANPAKAPMDFTAVSQTVNWAAGEVDKIVTVPIIDDSVDEANEVFSVNLTGPLSGATIGGSNPAIVTIVDNDEPDITPDAFPALDPHLGVEPNSFQQSQSFTIQGINAASPFNVGGGFISKNGSPCTLTSGTVANGDTVYLCHVTTSDFEETTSSVLVVGFVPPLMGVSAIFSSTARAIPTVQFDQTSRSVGESSGLQSIDAVLSSAIGQDVVVRINRGGTATAADFSPAMATSVTIPAGQTRATFSTTIVNDLLDEADEISTATISSASNAVVGSQSVFTLTIQDDDPTPSVSFTTAGQSNSETTRAVTVTAQLSSISGRAVTVPLTFSGTASNPADYKPGASSITIPAGASRGSLTMTVFDDSIYEAPNETVLVAISSPVNATPGTPSQQTVTIVDDDALRVSSIVLSPATATPFINAQHCLTATPKDAAGTPLASVPLSFQVTGVNPRSGNATTNSSGGAQFCYTGAVVGADTITASYLTKSGTAKATWK